jgi:hypothetical protein
MRTGSIQLRGFEKLFFYSAWCILLTACAGALSQKAQHSAGQIQTPISLAADSAVAASSGKSSRDSTTSNLVTSSQQPNASAAQGPALPLKLLGSILPQGLFGLPTKSGPSISKSNALTLVPTLPTPMAVLPSVAIKPTVLVYASQASSAYMSTLGRDASESVQAWESLLRKQSIPYKLVQTVGQLNMAEPTTLVLPSTVALSDQEKQAVVVFQRKGGAVLSTWLTGVRNEKGSWQGFGFMERVLGAKVVGTTEDNEDATYLVPHGDNPVSYHSPAGLRIWMARTKGWLPLRLVGKHSAANFMDWSRSAASVKHSSTVVFDEREQLTGNTSRSVVLGFPEQLWPSVDAQTLEPLILDALMWATHQPSAYLAAWPNPYSSAFTLAIDAADTMSETDLSYGKLTGDLGGRATYFVITEQAESAAAILKKIKSDGHEIGYLGDQFEEFKDQSTASQSKRIDTMVRDMRNADIQLATPVGLHPPMEAYDKTTLKILRDRKFGYLVGGLDATESRLPFLLESDENAPLIVLPRTQSDPEDLISQGDPAAGLKLFFSELDLSDKMAGLTVIRLSNRSSLTSSQFADFSDYLKLRRKHLWMASAGQIASWWRERENIAVTFDTTTIPPLLRVSIRGESPVQNAASVWINLPKTGQSMHLTPASQPIPAPKITPIDRWRAAVVLKDFPPGDYHWHVSFD